MTFPDYYPRSPDRVCCYNLDSSVTPGQMKVRWKIRIATGAEARRLDMLQQQAIINLLTWADSQQKHDKKQPAAISEIPGSNSTTPIPEYAQ